MPRQTTPIPDNGAVISTRCGGTRFAWIIKTGPLVDRDALRAVIEPTRSRFRVEAYRAAQELLAQRLPTFPTSPREVMALARKAKGALGPRGASSSRIKTPKSKAVLAGEAIILHAILKVAARLRARDAADAVLDALNNPLTGA